jgi:hypothetical protein
MLFDQFAHRATGVAVWRNGRTDGDTTVFGYFAGDKSDSADVQIAVLLGKAQFARMIMSDYIAVQERNRPAACLDEFGIEYFCQC